MDFDERSDEKTKLLTKKEILDINERFELNSTNRNLTNLYSIINEMMGIDFNRNLSVIEENFSFEHLKSVCLLIIEN